MRQLRLQQHGIRNVRHHHDQVVHRALLVAHRAKTDGKVPHRFIAAPHLQFEVLHLLPVRRRLQGRLEILPVRRLHPIDQPVPDQFIFTVSGFVTPPVGIADQARRIQHQNHALRGIQNLLVEVALALQLRLKRLLLRHIQHQPANLADAALRVAHRRNVLQRMKQRAILAPKRLLVVSQHAALGQSPAKTVRAPPVRDKDAGSHPTRNISSREP